MAPSSTLHPRVSRAGRSLTATRLSCCRTVATLPCRYFLQDLVLFYHALLLLSHLINAVSLPRTSYVLTPSYSLRPYCMSPGSLLWNIICACIYHQDIFILAFLICILSAGLLPKVPVLSSCVVRAVCAHNKLSVVRHCLILVERMGIHTCARSAYTVIRQT